MLLRPESTNNGWAPGMLRRGVCGEWTHGEGDMEGMEGKEWGPDGANMVKGKGQMVDENEDRNRSKGQTTDGNDRHGR